MQTEQIKTWFCLQICEILNKYIKLQVYFPDSLFVENLKTISHA